MIRLACLVMLAAGAARDDTAADVVTLRSGQEVLGQVVEPSPRGSMLVVVRRAWAEEQLPELAKRWETAEAGAVRRARADRRGRLSAWRRERAGHVGKDDPIVRWIDAELPRLADDAHPDPSPLMVARLSRGEVRSVVRQPKAKARMLRQGWLSGFARVEAMRPDDLRDALEARGFAPGGKSPVAVDRLLPIPVETEAEWLLRRAATEVLNDPGLKFLRTGPALLPEPEPGQPMDATGALSVLSDLKGLLEERPSDPLAGRLAEIASRGRIGAVVTALEISPDLASVRVESTLWVRRGPRWWPRGSRSSVARPDQLAPGAAEPLKDDPQIKAVFQTVESLGLGKVSDDVKRRSLNVGAATRQALGQVRSALIADLESRALPVRDEPPAAAKP
jgi:hypothetical protein